MQLGPRFISTLAALALAGCGGSSGGAAPTGVGAGGGTVDHLYFAVLGDTRPAVMDDTSGYPTSTITGIYRDIQAMSPRPQFAVATGDYMFASTTGTQAQPQMDLYLAARSAYSGTVFAAMGNDECDGTTAGDCTPGQTPNYDAFMSGLVAPLGQSAPYYAVKIGAADASWTAKLVVIACNAWSATQQSWLTAELASPTTYTIVVQHDPASVPTAPCVTATAALLAQSPYDLLLAGHLSTFEYVAPKELVVGNGGAPLLGSSIDFGYVTVEKVAAGWQVVLYDQATALPVTTLSVP